MAKKKNMLDLMKEVRGSWTINPRTRVQENELKNNKKRRQKDKKVVNEREE
jgi:hypothetical protein